MEEYKEFLLKLFKQLSTGDFTVMVVCANEKQFPADVIGYDNIDIKVRFHSDGLTKPGRKRVESSGWFYDDDTSGYTYVDCQVPIKEEYVSWRSIKLKN